MSLVKSLTATLELVAEDKIGNLLRGNNIPERLEASGVFFLNGYFYVIFDNLREIAKIKSDLADIQDNCYEFPTNERGKIIYCNVEGVCWLNSNRIVVVSDKYKTQEQPKRCQQKDQSIHIFQIPNLLQGERSD